MDRQWGEAQVKRFAYLVGRFTQRKLPIAGGKGFGCQTQREDHQAEGVAGGDDSVHFVIHFGGQGVLGVRFQAAAEERQGAFEDGFGWEVSAALVVVGWAVLVIDLEGEGLGLGCPGEAVGVFPGRKAILLGWSLFQPPTGLHVAQGIGGSAFVGYDPLGFMDQCDGDVLTGLEVLGKGDDCLSGAVYQILVVCGQYG